MHIPFEYGPAQQTEEHILMDCPLYITQKQHMTNAIETLYVKDNVPTRERQLYLNTLLAPYDSQANTRTIVRTELLNYLAAIDCNI